MLTPAPPPLAAMQAIAMLGGLPRITWSLLALGITSIGGVGLLDAIPESFILSTTNAVGFLVAGTSLLLYTYGPPSQMRRAVAQIGGGFVLLWGLVCSQPVRESSPGCPNWIRACRSKHDGPRSDCMRHSGQSRPCDTNIARTKLRRTPSLPIFRRRNLLMGGIATTGYLYRVPPMYDSTTYGPIDISTALLATIMVFRCSVRIRPRASCGP